MSRATHPHAMDAVSAVPASEQVPVPRARFTVLDETGRSPDEPPSALPRVFIGAASIAAVGLCAVFAVRGFGGEAKEAGTAPVVRAAPKALAPSPKQEEPNAPAPTGNGATPAAATKPAAAVQGPVPARTQTAKSAALALPVTSKAAPVKSLRRASDNPYADPPTQRAARSDNPY